ncbi:MAG: hypothetical protein LBS12_03665 [Prevotellaceae bacterium]|jgi:hypothetical protein|nr:hypothetical protein [Prevotellaceae bacterium]
MKNLFLITILFLSFATAWGQSTSVVRVEQLGADYSTTPPRVEFRVYWDEATSSRHLDSVWVFVDYQPIHSNGSLGAWTPATLTSPTATAPGTVSSLNGRGFYLHGTPAAGFSSTVTVELTGPVAGERFNWCAYVSDYPPNATAGAGFYELHGTPPFVINGSITEPTRQYSGCIDVLTDATGCPGLVPPPTEVTAFTVSDDTICKGETVTLEAAATGHSLYSFNNGNTWVPGGASTTVSFAPESTTTYTVHVMSAGGCSATAGPLTVTVHASPNTTFINPPTTACAGSSITLTVGDGSGSYCFTQNCSACARNPYSSGNDNPTDFDCQYGNATCTFEASNSYTVSLPDSGNVTVCVRVVNEHGCLDSACVTIGILPLPATPILAGGGILCASNDSLHCFGESGYTYQLQNSLLQNEGAVKTGANASLTFPISATGTYTVVVTDPVTNCTARSNAQTVDLSIPPVAPTSLTANADICLSLPATLTASGGNKGSGAVYEWGTGTTVGENQLSPATTTAASRTISVTTTDTYWVRLIGTTTCTDTTAGAALLPITGPDYGYTTVIISGTPLDVQNADANGGATTCWMPNRFCPPGWRWPTIAEMRYLVENQIVDVTQHWSSDNYDATRAWITNPASATSLTHCRNVIGIYPLGDCVALPWLSCGYAFCGYNYIIWNKTALLLVRCVR